MALLSMLLLGSLFPHLEIDYRWGEHVVRGDTLYAIRVTRHVAGDIPIPERSPPRVTKKDYDVVGIDLSGRRTSPQLVQARWIPDHMAPGADDLRDDAGFFGHVEVDDEGHVVLWGREALRERLTSGTGVKCAHGMPGRLVSDQQDARVAYLQCELEDLVYRVEWPTLHVDKIQTGPPVGMPHLQGVDFFSALGQKQVFVNVDRDTWRLDIGPEPHPVRIGGRIENNLRPTQTRSPRSLIGVADDLRIWQVRGAEPGAVQAAIEDHGVTRTFPLPAALVTSPGSIAVYLPRNRRVLWEVLGEIIGRTVIYTLDIDSGAVQRTVADETE